ncbi:Mbov_0396 family ICE element transmembrane protein [Mycoplasma sp. VS30B]
MFDPLYYAVYSAISSVLVGLPLRLISVIVTAYHLIAIDLPQYILFGVKISDGINGADVPYMFMRFVVVSLILWVFMAMFSVVRMHYAKMDGSDNYVRIAIKRSALGTLYLLGIPVIIFVANMLISLLVGVIIGGDGSNTTLSDTIWEVLYDKTALTSQNPPIPLESWKSWGSNGGYLIPYYPYRNSVPWGAGANIIITGAVIGLGTLYFLIMGIMLIVGKILQMFWLFIISPFVVSASIMDDGNRIKIWRQQYIAKQLSVLAFFVGIQIYIQFGSRASAFINSLENVDYLLKIILSIALYVGGALAVQNFGSEVSNFIGESASVKEGMQDLKSVISGGRVLGKMSAGGVMGGLAMSKKGADIARFGIGANARQLAFAKRKAKSLYKAGKISKDEMKNQIIDATNEARIRKETNRLLRNDRNQYNTEQDAKISETKNRMLENQQAYRDGKISKDKYIQQQEYEKLKLKLNKQDKKSNARAIQDAIRLKGRKPYRSEIEDKAKNRLLEIKDNLKIKK